VKVFTTAADNDFMAPVDLTIEQCRTLARIRRRQPGAEIRLHRTRDGVVVEVRRGLRSELARLDAGGRVEPEQRLRLAG
jgi:hypothetical protein